MHVVSDIKREPRTRGRYGVYVDGVKAFDLSSLDLSTCGLRVGSQISEEGLAEFEALAESSRAYELAIRFLGVRPRTMYEMKQYLSRKDCPQASIQEALQKLNSAGLLDDDAFSASWIANRQALRPRSKRMLEQELIAKGVSRESIATALRQIDGESELEALVQLAQRKHQMSQYRDRNKLTAYLARKGYRYELIKMALERLD
ncbi:MAG TPA: RecX family transcriptional regulator [Candidatus Saccharimonadia bacterium]|nr:RecX family transcriptional regulator [Candidatus Saccharimonadia bacterium]